ncbi:MAG: hypothetical protein RL514_4703 [Verrucomicrobiota bacterium]|jgi:hypothetical protein
MAALMDISESTVEEHKQRMFDKLGGPRDIKHVITLCAEALRLPLTSLTASPAPEPAPALGTPTVSAPTMLTMSPAA